MGLTSFWSNFTGPKVKEIQPQQKCKWLEKDRPATSAGVRTGKKAAQQRLRPEILIDSRPTTAHEEKKAKKKNHIFRNSGQKSEDESKGHGRVPSKTIDPAEKDLPEVPALSSPTFAPERTSAADLIPAEELVRPGTAITTNDSISTTEVYELSGQPSPPLHSPSSATILSPLPSPTPQEHRVPTSPKRNISASLDQKIPASPEPRRPASSEPKNEWQAQPPTEQTEGLRKRSNSSASGKSRLKRASWFQRSKSKPEIVFPTPLPPPTSPPPPPPPLQTVVADLPCNEVQPPSLKRSASVSSSMLQSPVSAVTKNSLDSDSLLMSFPFVPSPSQEDAKTLDSGVPNSETGYHTETIARSPIDASKQPHIPNPRPHIAKPMQNIDTLLKSTTSPPETPKRDSKVLPTALNNSNHDDRKSITFSEELQREYDKVTLMMDLAEPTPSEGVIAMVGGFDFGTVRGDAEEEFWNDEALAALEFGIENEFDQGNQYREERVPV